MKKSELYHPAIEEFVPQSKELTSDERRKLGWIQRTRDKAVASVVKDTLEQLAEGVISIDDLSADVQFLRLQREALREQGCDVAVANCNGTIWGITVVYAEILGVSITEARIALSGLPRFEDGNYVIPEWLASTTLRSELAKAREPELAMVG